MTSVQETHRNLHIVFGYLEGTVQPYVIVYVTLINSVDVIASRVWGCCYQTQGMQELFVRTGGGAGSGEDKESDGGHRSRREEVILWKRKYSLIFIWVQVIV